MTDRNVLYIDGAWVASGGSGMIPVVGAATEQVLATVPDGVAADVDAAVAAARRAADDWAGTAVADRAKILKRVSGGLLARQNEIALTISAEMGMPYAQANVIQVGLPAMTWASMADLVGSYAFEERVHNSLLVREPVGVVGAITPWNYPLHQISGKLAPALGAGCTVVLKPSEVAPLSAYLLLEILHDLGLPPGVVNLVSGTGPVVGEALAAHADVDMITFTGSTAAGKRVSEAGASNVKRVTLELGGKSPYLILDDLEGEQLQAAVGRGIAACLLNSGQTCSALTRMVVPRSRLPEVEAIVAGGIATTVLGDPLDPATTLGPLVSDVQRDRVRGYIRTGIDEGAKLLVGGPDTPEGLDVGYYVSPTAFSEVTPDMRIAQEEIFGPVLVIQPYEDEAEAIRIANDTQYGLAGGVWSGDEERAKAVARRIRTGQVEINGGVFNPLAPFGSYKQSGHGRELGRLGVEEFLAVKSLQL